VMIERKKRGRDSGSRVRPHDAYQAVMIERKKRGRDSGSRVRPHDAYQAVMIERKKRGRDGGTGTKTRGVDWSKVKRGVQPISNDKSPFPNMRTGVTPV